VSAVPLVDTPPAALPVNPDGIPDELKEHRQFFAWDWEFRRDRHGDGKWTKPPMSPWRDGYASVTNPSTWATFDVAMGAYERRDYAGIGFALTKDDPYFFVDLDHYRDPETGAIDGWAEDIIRVFHGTYREISPTETGIKIIGKGRLPGTNHTRQILGARPLAKVEVFDREKYTTLTGHRCDAAPTRLADCQAALTQLSAKLWPVSTAAHDGPHRAVARSIVDPANDDDDQRLARVRGSAQGAAFTRLFDGGDLSAYGGDQSSADLALADYLAFWFGPDPTRIDRMFRRSALMREKWDKQHYGDGRTYGQATIDKALAGRTEFYAPSPSPNQAAAPGGSVSSVSSIADTVEEEHPWPERQDLPPIAPAVPRIGPEMLPPPLRPWLTDHADRLCVPLEMVAIPALVALGATIGRHVAIRPNAFDDFGVVPNLWGAVIARPGQMKSEVVDAGVKPLKHLAATAHDRYQLELDAATAKQERIKAEIESIKGAMRDASKKGGLLDDLESRLAAKQKELREASLPERRYITHDATVEKLGELLRDNPRGLLLLRDELAGWIRTLDKPGREGDREFYLESWNGTGSYVADRIGRGTVHIPALTLSALGGIQPGKLRRLITGAIEEGAGDDGLLQRFQLMVWPDGLGAWKPPARWPDHGARDWAFEIFRRLDELDLREIHAQGGDREIPYLKFTAEAQALYNGWRDTLEQRLRSSELHDAPAFASHISKYRSLLPSLALIFHLVDIANGTEAGPVSAGAFRLAAAWCEFLEAHAQNVYAEERNAGVATAHALATKITAGAIHDGDAVRELYRMQWEGLTTPDRVLKGLTTLEELGWLHTETIRRDGPGTKGGRPSHMIRLRPELRQRKGPETPTPLGGDDDA
jgi:hypothetical protein